MSRGQNLQVVHKALNRYLDGGYEAKRLPRKVCGRVLLALGEIYLDQLVRDLQLLANDGDASGAARQFESVDLERHTALEEILTLTAYLT